MRRWTGVLAIAFLPILMHGCRGSATQQLRDTVDSSVMEAAAAETAIGRREIRREDSGPDVPEVIPDDIGEDNREDAAFHEVCLPNCDEKECGDNGCGGSCGECAGANCSCSDGSCECSCSVCECFECGNEKWGDSCGECLEGGTCIGGLCLPLDNQCDDGNDIPWDGCTAGNITEFQVNSFWDGRQWSADTASLPGGGYVAVWESYPWDTPWSDPPDADIPQDGDAHGVAGRAFGSDGQPVCPEFIANTAAEGWQWQPSVTAFPDGKFLAAWNGRALDDGQSGYPWHTDIVAQLFAADCEKLGEEFGFHTVTDMEALLSRPVVQAVGPDTVAFAYVLGAEEWYGGVLRGGVITRSGQAVSEYYQTNPCSDWGYGGGDKLPDITALNDGSYVVVWTRVEGKCPEWTGVEERVYGRRYSALGEPQGAEFPMSQEYMGIFSVSAAPQVDGGFIAGWASSEEYEGPLDFRMQRFDKEGNQVGPPIYPDTSGQKVGRGTVTTLPGGDFAVAWWRRESDCVDTIQARRYHADGAPVHAPVQANTYVLGTFWETRVAAVNSGFVVLWVEIGQSGPLGFCWPGQDGDDFGIFGQRFDAEGNKVYH